MWQRRRQLVFSNNYKGAINIIPITKRQAAYLREKLGDTVYISKPTKNGKVYVTETPRVKRVLANFGK